MKKALLTNWGQILFTVLMGMAFLTGGLSAQMPLDPGVLTKYIDPLPVPGVMPQAGPNYYEIGM